MSGPAAGSPQADMPSITRSVMVEMVCFDTTAT
jgi:hypothetical protein